MWDANRDMLDGYKEWLIPSGYLVVPEGTAKGFMVMLMIQGDYCNPHQKTGY